MVKYKTDENFPKINFHFLIYIFFILFVLSYFVYLFNSSLIKAIPKDFRLSEIVD